MPYDTIPLRSIDVSVLELVKESCLRHGPSRRLYERQTPVPDSGFAPEGALSPGTASRP